MRSSPGHCGVLARALTCALGLCALAGCGGRPPESVAAQYAGPIRSRDVAEGRHIFATLCAACHAGRVNPAGYHWTPAHMRHQIREGNALMPALRASRLADDQVEAVLAYLSTVDAIDGELPPHSEEWPDAMPDEWPEEEDGWSDGVARAPGRPPSESAVRSAATPTDDAAISDSARALGSP